MDPALWTKGFPAALPQHEGVPQQFGGHDQQYDGSWAFFPPGRDLHVSKDQFQTGEYERSQAPKQECNDSAIAIVDSGSTAWQSESQQQAWNLSAPPWLPEKPESSEEVVTRRLKLQGESTWKVSTLAWPPDTSGQASSKEAHVSEHPPNAQPSVWNVSAPVWPPEPQEISFTKEAQQESEKMKWNVSAPEWKSDSQPVPSSGEITAQPSLQQQKQEQDLNVVAPGWSQDPKKQPRAAEVSPQVSAQQQHMAMWMWQQQMITAMAVNMLNSGFVPPVQPMQPTANYSWKAWADAERKRRAAQSHAAAKNSPSGPREVDSIILPVQRKSDVMEQQDETGQPQKQEAVIENENVAECDTLGKEISSAVQMFLAGEECPEDSDVETEKTIVEPPSAGALRMGLDGWSIDPKSSCGDSSGGPGGASAVVASNSAAHTDTAAVAYSSHGLDDRTENSHNVREIDLFSNLQPHRPPPPASPPPGDPSLSNTTSSSEISPNPSKNTFPSFTPPKDESSKASIETSELTKKHYRQQVKPEGAPTSEGVQDFLNVLRRRKLPAELTGYSDEKWQQIHFKIESVITSLYREQVRPSQSLVQRRLREQNCAETVIVALLPLCARMPERYRIMPPMQGEQPVILLTREPRWFGGWADTQSSDDIYRADVWDAFVTFLRERSGKPIPGPALKAAEEIKICGPTLLICQSVGTLQHMVRLALGEKQLLEFRGDMLHPIGTANVPLQETVEVSPQPANNKLPNEGLPDANCKQEALVPKFALHGSRSDFTASLDQLISANPYGMSFLKLKEHVRSSFDVDVCQYMLCCEKLGEQMERMTTTEPLKPFEKKQAPKNEAAMHEKVANEVFSDPLSWVGNRADGKVKAII